MKKLATILSLIIIFLPLTASSAWLDPTFTYRKAITVQSTQVNETVTDFPVYLNVADLGADFFANAKSDFTDVRITTSTGDTTIPHELVWGSMASSSGEIWFKAPTISSSTNTTFYIYYGSSTAANTSTPNTWNSSYAGVFHLQGLTDSTNNARNLTTVSGNVATTTAYFGNGYAFTQDQTPDQHLNRAGAITTSTNNFSMSVIVSSTDVTADGSGKIPVYNGDNGASAGGFGIATIINSGTNWGALDGNVAWRSSGNSLSANTWYLLHLVCNSGTYYFYQNGTQTASTATCGPGAAGASFNIGNGEDTYDQDFPGKVDEVRVINSVLTRGWIETEYNNFASSTAFYSVGTQETQGGGGASPIKKRIILWGI